MIFTWFELPTRIYKEHVVVGLVLFEDYNGTPQYVAGDDASGYARNSKLSVRLLNGRTYFLRIRLYYASDQGKGAVMLW